MQAEARFDGDRTSVGLEVELNLTDENGVLSMVNAQALERIADADFETGFAAVQRRDQRVAPRRLTVTCCASWRPRFATP